jgi:hypothetical protein
VLSQAFNSGIYIFDFLGYIDLLRSTEQKLADVLKMRRDSFEVGLKF